MKKSFQKMILPLAILSFVFSCGIVSAQTTATTGYVLLVPDLPGIGATTDLATYLPAVFNLSIGVAAALAFIMLTFGGIMYATSDAITGKSRGREYIEDALWGLLLVIGAYAILYTINPKILQFDLNINAIPKADISLPSATAGAGCSTCTTLASAQIPTSGSAVGSSVTPALLSELTTLNTKLTQSSIAWAVTEGYPPSDTVHASTCHYNGNCVDAKLISATATNINTFYDDAVSTGMTTAYEVQTISARNSLISAGVRPAIVVVNPNATGPHFHVNK